MATGAIKVQVKCPSCDQSLMNPEVPVDGLPGIDLQTEVHGRSGRVYLSQIYGSYNRQLEGVEDMAGSLARFSCPRCRQAFPEYGTCACGAAIIGFALQIGGIIKICTRNGCKKHSLEFEDAGDAFALFQSQDGSILA